MNKVNPIEVHDNIAHVYINSDDVWGGWEYIPSYIDRFISNENLGPINATVIHYSGWLLSKTYISNEQCIDNNGNYKEPGNVSLDYLFSNIPNLTICFNTSYFNTEEVKSCKECICDSKLATSDNIVFADPEWTINESSDNTDTQIFGCDEDSNDLFFKKHYPWRSNPDCSTLEGLIEWGYALAREFEDGKLSIRNYLADLYRMA